jgi:hypothetical protein
MRILSAISVSRTQLTYLSTRGTAFRDQPFYSSGWFGAALRPLRPAGDVYRPL